MTVAALIALLQGCDPGAVVLISTASPRGERCEGVVEAAPISAGRFARGAAAKNGAVRSCAFPMVLMLGDQDISEGHLGWTN